MNSEESLSWVLVRESRESTGVSKGEFAENGRQSDINVWRQSTSEYEQEYSVRLAAMVYLPLLSNIRECLFKILVWIVWIIVKRLVWQNVYWNSIRWIFTEYEVFLIRCNGCIVESFKTAMKIVIHFKCPWFLQFAYGIYNLLFPQLQCSYSICDFASELWSVRPTGRVILD